MLQIIYKRLLLSAILAFVLSISIFAQSGNLPYVDGRFIHFGFSLGMSSMDFGITPSRDSIGTGAEKKVYDMGVSDLNPGFSVGIITDMRLNRYLNLRFTPTLNLESRKLFYQIVDSKAKPTTLSITSIPVCLPIYLKYSAERKENYRPYVIWGGGIALDLGRNTTTDMMLLKPLDFYTEFGVGCDIYFSFFKLSPELKFAVGFNNLVTPLDQRVAGTITTENEYYTLALSKLTSRMLTLTFNFE